MSDRHTIIVNKLIELNKSIGDYEIQNKVGNSDIPVSHIAPFLNEVVEYLNELDTSIKDIEQSWTKLTWALEAVHGQTPRDIFEAYNQLNAPQT